VMSTATVASAPLREAPMLRGFELLALTIALGAWGSLLLRSRLVIRKSRS